MYTINDDFAEGLLRFMIYVYDKCRCRQLLPSTYNVCLLYMLISTMSSVTRTASCNPGGWVLGLSSRLLSQELWPVDQSTQRGMNYRKLTTTRSVHTDFIVGGRRGVLEPACHIAANAAG